MTNDPMTNDTLQLSKYYKACHIFTVFCFLKNPSPELTRARKLMEKLKSRLDIPDIKE